MFKKTILLFAAGANLSCTQQTESLSHVYLFNSCTFPIMATIKNGSNYPPYDYEVIAPPNTSTLIAIYSSTETDLEVLIQDNYALSAPDVSANTVTITGPELRTRLRTDRKRNWLRTKATTISSKAFCP